MTRIRIRHIVPSLPEFMDFIYFLGRQCWRHTKSLNSLDVLFWSSIQEVPSYPALRGPFSPRTNGTGGLCGLQWADTRHTFGSWQSCWRGDGTDESSVRQVCGIFCCFFGVLFMVWFRLLLFFVCLFGFLWGLLSFLFVMLFVIVIIIIIISVFGMMLIIYAVSSPYLSCSTCPWFMRYYQNGCCS